MSDYYDELLTLAKAATKGDWIAVGPVVENVSDHLPDICSTSDRAALHDSDRQQCADADYIAAANPKVVMAMVHRIRALEKVVTP